MKKIICLMMCIVVMTISVTGLVACNNSSNTKEDKINVRIAYFPNITHTQALILKNQKTLEKKWNDNCEVSWKSFNAGPAEVEAIFAGEIDLGYIGPVPALSANVKSNGDVKIITNATNAGAILLKRKGAKIDSVANLSGKKIAVPQLGNTQHLCLLNILNDNHLKTVEKGGNVTVSASSNADIVNLMDNGTVDAALVPEPWGTTILNNGNAEILLDYDEVFENGNYPTAVVVVNKEFQDKYPELVEEFLEAHDEATVYINKNKEEAMDIVNDEIKNATGKAITSEVIQSAFERISVSKDLNKDAIMKFATSSQKEGFMSEVPEVKDVFENEK